MAKNDKTMKATNRNMRSKKDGSVLNANHVTLEATREGQSHIDQSRFKDNAYWRFESDGKVTAIKGGTGGFNATKHEIKRYKELFGEGLEARNERYIKNRNKNRCQTIEQLYRNPKTAPLETLWQIGNSKTVGMAAYEMRLAVFKAWSDTVTELRKLYGDNIKFLDAGLHMEEAVPHIHSRIVIGATDEYGHFMPNQSQGFKEMGIERPDPTKAQSKYNSPLIAFSDKVREMFYQNCEKQGLQIDREVKSASHRQKEMLEYQIEQLQKEAEHHKEVSRTALEALERANNEIESLSSEIKSLKADKAVLGEEKKQLNQDIAEKKDMYQELERKVENKKVEVKKTIEGLDEITSDLRAAQSRALPDPTIVGEGKKRKGREKVDTVELYKDEYFDWKAQRQLVPKISWIADAIDRSARKIEQIFKVDELVNPWKERAERSEMEARAQQIARTKSDRELQNIKWFLKDKGLLYEYEQERVQEITHSHHHRR